MKSMLQVFFVLAVYCFFSAGTAFAASGSSVGAAEGRTRTAKGAPLAEMMFYEAAEQAVEDGYGRIIPDSESENADKDAAVKSEQAGKDAASSDVTPQSKE